MSQENEKPLTPSQLRTHIKVVTDKMDPNACVPFRELADSLARGLPEPDAKEATDETERRG